MMLICNGMTRAGSTLQYNLARHLVSRFELGSAHGFFSRSTLPREVPDWLTDSDVHVVKMHDVWNPPESQSAIRRCYIYRDIRDVAASAKQKFPISSFGEVMSILRDAVRSDCDIRAISQLVQRYEEVFSDSVHATRELATFLGIRPTSDECVEVAKLCLSETKTSVASFPDHQKRRHFQAQRRTLLLKRIAALIPQKAKRALENCGVRPLHQTVAKTRSQAHSTTLLHPDHFSPTRGQAGAWRYLFSKREQAAIQHDFQDWLIENQYPIYDSFEHQSIG